MWAMLLHVWNTLTQCVLYEILFAVVGVLIMMRGTLFLQPFWIVKELIAGLRADRGKKE